MNRWVGKVAVVTGASAGIGAVIAEKLVKEGLQVVGFARRKEKVEQLSEKLLGEKGKLYALKVDISNPDEVVNAFNWVKENLGPVHILINNAGITQNTTLSDGDYAKWKKVLDVNVLGLSVATREAVTQMKENGIDGHIVHINSICGHKVLKFPGLGTYSASKYAVTALAETLLNEINEAKLKIKVTSVSPGAVDTEFSQADGCVPEEVTKKVIDYPSLSAEEVADAVLYVLGTPSTVLIRELTLTVVGENF